jgi:ABC-type transport system involved in cytochrome c biogenesis permease subunit
LAVIVLGAFVLVFVNMVIDNMPKGEVQKVENYVPWEKETIEAVESLPVQDGGRIKPLSTFAAFRMLGAHGARSMKVEDKDGVVYKLKPTQWLMDTLFRPHLAVQLPTFRVDNSDVLKAIGVKVKGKRDRYSYLEIEPGFEKLEKLAQTYEPIEKKERDPVQQQTIDLYSNLRDYNVLLSYFAFARNGVLLQGSGAEGEDQRVQFSALMTTSEEIMTQVRASRESGEALNPRLETLLQQVFDGANFAKFGLFMLPPKDEAERDWLSAGQAIMGVVAQETADPKTSIDDTVSIEMAVQSMGVSEKAFRDHIIELKERVVKRAEARGEYKHIDMEVSYFKRDYFLNAMVYFLIASVSALVMWGVGGLPSKIASWVTAVSTVVAATYCVVAIVIRCIIMERPPVGNLYDTVIFIATTGVIFCLLVELMSRKRFALGLAPIMGTMLILLARRYELGDASDHFNPLVAVLDSNFWLATHVITISLGYSAGLLSAFLSLVYVLIRGLNLDGGDKDLRRSLSKAVYGCICLTVFLSLVGTVLGGIWANYSWGRFWGWDPKENGALMIVLWTLGILHARLGGIIKEWGLHLASLFTACVVAFSWWHVNFLGVGLHNYGFTGKAGIIWTFYGSVMGVILLGAFAMLIEYLDKQQRKEKSAASVKGLEA